MTLFANTTRALLSLSLSLSLSPLSLYRLSLSLFLSVCVSLSLSFFISLSPFLSLSLSLSLSLFLSLSLARSRSARKGELLRSVSSQHEYHRLQRSPVTGRARLPTDPGPELSTSPTVTSPTIMSPTAPVLRASPQPQVSQKKTRRKKRFAAVSLVLVNVIFIDCPRQNSAAGAATSA